MIALKGVAMIFDGTSIPDLQKYHYCSKSRGTAPPLPDAVCGFPKKPVLRTEEQQQSKHSQCCIQLFIHAFFHHGFPLLRIPHNSQEIFRNKLVEQRIIGSFAGEERRKHEIELIRSGVVL